MAEFTHETRFRIDGTVELKAALQKLGASAPKAGGAVLFQEGQSILAVSKERVPVDMGALRVSGHVQLPKVGASEVQVEMGYGGPAASYAVFIHEGTGPAVGRPAFMPPSSALEGWVRRNLDVKESEVKGVAFLVAKAIGERGQEPNRFLGDPFEAAQAGMASRLARRLKPWLDGAAR